MQVQNGEGRRRRGGATTTTQALMATTVLQVGPRRSGCCGRIGEVLRSHVSFWRRSSVRFSSEGVKTVPRVPEFVGHQVELKWTFGPWANSGPRATSGQF